MKIQKAYSVVTCTPQKVSLIPKSLHQTLLYRHNDGIFTEIIPLQTVQCITQKEVFQIDRAAT